MAEAAPAVPTNEGGAAPAAAAPAAPAVAVPTTLAPCPRPVANATIAAAGLPAVAAAEAGATANPTSGNGAQKMGVAITVAEADPPTVTAVAAVTPSLATTAPTARTITPSTTGATDAGCRLSRQRHRAHAPSSSRRGCALTTGKLTPTARASSTAATKTTVIMGSAARTLSPSTPTRARPTSSSRLRSIACPPRTAGTLT